MQYTPTMVRVAMVEEQSNDTISGVSRGISRRNSYTATGSSSSAETDAGGPGSNHVHWTIDLSYDAYPVVSKPKQLPHFRSSARNLFGKAPKVEGTAIIGGGVIWFSRGENQRDDEATSLNLIIVASTSVLVYNMNTVKRQLIKTHIFPHNTASSFWYEPISSTLMIGSYRSNLSQTLRAGDSEKHQASLASFSMGDQEDLHEGESNEEILFPNAVMSMKTLFFSKTDSPLVETFPTFTVGTLREVVSDEVEEHHELQLSLETFDTAALERIGQEEDPESAVVLPTEVHLFNLYGSVYCIELGSLGLSQGGIGLTKLDKSAGCIHVRHQVSCP